MILVDTSVWLDFLAGRENIYVSTLEKLVADDDICLCGVILTEILQGIRSEKEYATTKKYFQQLTILPHTIETFVAAADIYRNLRKKGLTVRKPIDCMIAAVAIEHATPLLQNDRDFIGISKHCGLELVPLRA
ncbi:MAG: PIN domain nuclease [Candidatus Hydrogenedentes bacterium]|nr:PIN domain nuclease [Candidatus Hydrogenedentota bacterium]